MIGWGILLIVLGAGSLLLPMFGWQFTLMELVADYQPYAGIVAAVIGVALVLVGMNRRGASAPASPTPAATAPATPPPADARVADDREGRP
jgi:hypothetical protein